MSLEGTLDRVVQYVQRENCTKWSNMFRGNTGQGGPICLEGTLDRVVQWRTYIIVEEKDKEKEEEEEEEEEEEDI